MALVAAGGDRRQCAGLDDELGDGILAGLLSPLPLLVRGESSAGLHLVAAPWLLVVAAGLGACGWRSALSVGRLVALVVLVVVAADSARQDGPLSAGDPAQ